MNQGNNNNPVEDREKGAMSVEIAPSPSTLEDALDLSFDTRVEGKSTSKFDEQVVSDTLTNGQEQPTKENERAVEIEFGADEIKDYTMKFLESRENISEEYINSGTPKSRDYSIVTSPVKKKLRCVDNFDDEDIYVIDVLAPSPSKTNTHRSGYLPADINYNDDDDIYEVEIDDPSTSKTNNPYPTLKAGIDDLINKPHSRNYRPSELSCHFTEAKSYQLDYLYRKVMYELERGRRCVALKMTYRDNPELADFHSLLIKKCYQTARQCIAAIDNFFSSAYINQKPSKFQTSENLKAIRYLEELFHQQIIDMSWTVKSSDNEQEVINESPYYPISVLQRSGRLTNQLKYLRDKVITYLRNHKYSFLLQREKSGPRLLAGDVEKGQMITLDFIENRLKKNEYYTASECVADIDTLFMDCYVHKTVDKEYLQTIALFQIGFHDEIAKMMVGEEEIENDGIEYYPSYGTREEENTYQLQFIKNTVATELSKHEYADPFKNSEELKQYLSILYGEDVVEEPIISLSKIKKRLERNEYRTALECIQDYDVMFDKVFQTGLEEQLLYVQAKGLKKIFEVKIKSIRKAIGL